MSWKIRETSAGVVFLWPESLPVTGGEIGRTSL